MPTIQLDQPVLLAMLNRVVPFVSSRATIPVLETVKLEIGADFAITANNLDVLATVRTAGGERSGAGATCVYAHKLRQIVRALDPAARIELAWEEGARVSLHCGATEYLLVALSAADFPGLDPVEASHSFTLPIEDAQRLFRVPAFAMSFEETRYYLNGIYLHQDGGNLRAVATDGRRLCGQDVPLPEGADGMPGAIVPAALVRRLGALMGARGLNGVSFEIGAKKIRVTLGGLELVGKLINGTYPDYPRVLPKADGCRITVAQRHLVAAARRIGAMSWRRSNCIARIDVGAGGLSLSLANPDLGEVTDRLPVEGSGHVEEIRFNIGYLIDGLAAHRSEDVTVAFCKDSPQGAPVLITGGEGCFVVQMPARV